MGTDFRTGHPVMANVYSFPERIHDFEIDTLHNSVLIQLRGIRKGKWLNNKGEVIRYDTENKKVLWVDKVAFQVEQFQLFGGLTLHSNGAKTFCLDNQTGEKRWKVRNSIIFTDPDAEIGIGYKIQPGNVKADNILEGIDLTNGNTVWQREINRDYGWNDVFYRDDSTLMIVAAGLHTVNVFDGSGWDYHTTTGKKDYTASAVGTGLGVVAGLLTGMYSVSTGYNLLRDVVSNVLIADESIFLASKTHIARLDFAGEIIWLKKLPDELTSKSQLIKLDSNVIMVNKGFAYKGQRQLEYGEPFIASFDIHSGNQVYLKTLANDNKAIIKDMKLQNEGKELVVVFDNRITKFELKTGESLNHHFFGNDEFGELKFFIGDHVYLKKDSIFQPLNSLNTTCTYVYTDAQKILEINNKLEPTEEIGTSDLYINYLTRNSTRFLAKGDTTYAVDESGSAKARFTASEKSIFLNNSLYTTNKTSLLEIDIGSILNE